VSSNLRFSVTIIIIVPLLRLSIVGCYFFCFFFVFFLVFFFSFFSKVHHEPGLHVAKLGVAGGEQHTVEDQQPHDTRAHVQVLER
jgi:hypothetical protein